MSETPDGARISVMLIVGDAAAAVRWYQEALGASLLWDLHGVAALELSGAPFLLHQAVIGKGAERSPTDAGLTTTRIEVFVEEPGVVIERAERAGARDVEAPTHHEVPWGRHLQGGFTDPFGHRWSVGDKTPLRRFPG